jgi:Cytochrome P460
MESKKSLEGDFKKRIAFLLVVIATVAGVLAIMSSASGRSYERANVRAAKQADQQASPLFGVKIPSGYRDWKLISVAHEEGDFNQLRAQLGNDIAIKAYREGKLPFPDGSIIVALHWKRVPSDEDNKVFGRVQAFVAGSATNMQVMVKDSKKYAATGGWGFGDFWDRKPSDEAMHKACFPCHEPAKANDYVFTHYAP